MVFSSLSFIFLFLPALLAAYFLLGAGSIKIKNLILLVFSIGFYACGGLRFLPALAASVVFNYLFGLLVSNKNPGKTRKTAIFCATAFNLGLLVWFKYIGFFAEIVNSLNIKGLKIPVPTVVLPIGISFYTFQGMSYVFDVYYGNAKAERNIFKVALYILLFPQLVAGPIVRYHTIAEQISCRKETLEGFSQGFMRFLFGLAKKVLLANQLGRIADAAFSAPAAELSAGMAWLGVISYTFQLYFDFSGYSDMAIGMGRAFGLSFPENFNYPYISQSITEFWRRWHMSLSTWFRDYLYIPLGGSRVVLWKQIRNLLVVWTLTGFWHGAAWNFLLWGLFYAVLLIGERYIWGKAVAKLPGFFRHVYALFFICIGWLLFRSGSVQQISAFLSAMFGSGKAGGWDGQATYYLLEFRWELLIALLASLPPKKAVHSFLERREERLWANFLLNWGAPALSLILGFFSVMRLITSSFNPFIYFQF